jgi:hypothetical protein
MKPYLLGACLTSSRVVWDSRIKSNSESIGHRLLVDVDLNDRYSILRHVIVVQKHRSAAFASKSSQGRPILLLLFHQPLLFLHLLVFSQLLDP